MNAAQVSPESTVPSPLPFSPAPWRLNQADLTVRSINDGLVHVHAFAERDAQDEANAKLIAAAPELFDACRAVLHAVEKQATDTIWVLPPFQGAAVHESVVDRLQSVLEKVSVPDGGARTIPDGELEEVRPVVSFQVWVRLKKSSKYYGQGQLENGKAAFFKLDGFDPQDGMALMSDCHSLRFNSNSYRREDCEFYLVDPNNTKAFVRIA